MGAASARERETQAKVPKTTSSAKPPKVALLAIDLLNDFLGEESSFFMAKRDSPLLKKRDDLLQRIGTLAEEVREANGSVIFVNAIYGEVPPGPHPYPRKSQRNNVPFNSDFLSGTHSGKDPCCIRGTAGAELHPRAASLKKEGANHQEGCVVRTGALLLFHSTSRDVHTQCRGGIVQDTRESRHRKARVG